MPDRDRYEEGYRDGLEAARTPGMDDPDREPGAHNVGQLTRDDVKVMTASQVNENWDEVQRVLKDNQ